MGSKDRSNMKPNKGQNFHRHSKGCLTYKTLKKRYTEQNRQIGKAYTEIMKLQRFKAAVMSANVIERIGFMLTAKIAGWDND